MSRRLEVTPRLVYWTAPHPRWRPNPGWPEDVGCVLYRGKDELVLVDPLVRDDLDADAWTWLDAEVGRAESVVIVLTAPWHLRSAPAAAERYNAPVWAAAAGRARAGDLPWRDELPAEVEAFTPAGRDEGQVAFWLPGEQALVVAEFFAGRDGGLELDVSPAETDVRAFADSLEELRRLPVEHVLVAHGKPVIGGGSKAIAAAVDSFRANCLP
jgi:glyoxylase-like metal-dependent hydrolase (beta-lactamase superfamily II)